MKRAQGGHETATKVVGMGSCGLDYLAQVAAFPQPDDKLRTERLQVHNLYPTLAQRPVKKSKRHFKSVCCVLACRAAMALTRRHQQLRKVKQKEHPAWKPRQKPTCVGGHTVREQLRHSATLHRAQLP